MPSGGIRLFLGPDRPRKLQRVRALEHELGIQPLDRHRVEAAAVSAGDLLALCRQQPAVSPLRLIVVDEAHRLNAAGVEGLLEHAGVIAKTAVVVLLVDSELGARQALTKAASAFETERFLGGPPAPTNPFALTDALGRADAAAALGAVRAQLAEGKEPTKLLGLVGWQLQQWVTVKRLLAQRAGTAQVASATGLKPWRVERVQAEVARRPLARLQDHLAACWRLDVDAKSGRALPDVALEQLVAEICLGAEASNG